MSLFYKIKDERRRIDEHSHNHNDNHCCHGEEGHGNGHCYHGEEGHEHGHSCHGEEGHEHGHCCHGEEGHEHRHCCHGEEGHEHGHAHSHSHGCGCGCEEIEIDNKKLIAGVGLFLTAMIIFNIPGLFKSVDAVMLDTIELVAFLLIYLFTANEIVVNAIKNLFKGKALDEQFLMTIASLGAFFVGEYSEACAVMLFYLVGEAFQDYAVDKSRKSITDLMDIRPDYANIMDENKIIKKVAPMSVKIGDIIIVKPGEKIPLDGVVVEGRASLDMSSLTGESIPQNVSDNDNVISGAINLDGVLTIKVTKKFGDSTVSKIIDLVENAGEKKAKTERFITRFAKIYTPIVVVLALLIAFVPPIFNVVISGAYIGDFYGVWNEWIYRALSFLVISCPCALVISVPLSFFAGIGSASTKGILIKGSNYLEAIAKCDTVVFDKTGTLTKGIFKVKEIKSVVSDEEFLSIAMVAELFSNHPIAKSIKDALYSVNADMFSIIQKDSNNISIEEMHGKGIKAIYNNEVILVGNEKLMQAEGIKYENTKDCGTIMHVSKNGMYYGYAIIADEIKETSQETISKLKKLGVNNIVMLTGDKREIAMSMASEIGVDKVYAELLPADKVAHVEKLLEESNTLAFVGDGVNDAPVLARANIGIAMGAMGSDAAIEAADLVLMDDNPLGIVKSIKLSRRTLNIAKQNIVFALSVKIAVLILAALGVATMWAAVFADVGVCVAAIINAMRCSK